MDEESTDAAEDEGDTSRSDWERELLARSTAMDASIDGMAILDEDEEYTYMNQAHAEIYGYDDPSELLGETWRICYSDEELVRFEEEVVPELFAEGGWRGEARGTRKDGSTFPQELSLSTLQDGGLVCVLRDISERKRYQRELERQNDRLNTFAEVVSHDLRNPLNVAQGRLEMALEQSDDQNLEVVKRSLDRMNELVDDILTLARHGQSVEELEPVDLKTVSRDSWQGIQSKDQSLNIESSGQILADRSRLNQLLENLFRNAVQHGDGETTLSVGTTKTGFYVADDGPGIPEAEREKVRQWGYTTDRKGTGFGLGIVAELAEAHGWTMSIESSESGGVRIEFAEVERPPNAEHS